MVNVSEVITRDMILEYAEMVGAKQAADWLLLYGPDGFEGSYDDYESLISFLEAETR